MLWPGTFQMRKSTLLSFPSGSGRLPTKRVQRQVDRSYKRRVKRKVKWHGRYLWHLSPRLERGQTDGRGQDCRGGWALPTSGEGPDMLPSHLPSVPKRPRDLSQECSVTTTLLCHEPFQEIKFEVAQPC